MVLKDVQTDLSTAINVAMIDTGLECDLGRLEWIIRREVDVEKEDTSRVW